MTNIVSQRTANNEIVVVVLFAMIFTALNVVYSTHYGRLAVPPTYDDIGFIANGFVLLDAGYQHGWGQWLLDIFTKTWHAPVTALQACLAFAVFDKAVWAPYLLNGLYLIGLLILLRREFVSLSIGIFLAIAISIVAWPLTSHLIVEFRPDIATNLFLALGTWRLAKVHEEIGRGQYRDFPSIWEMSWPFLGALWLKPSFSPVVIGLWLSAWILLCGVNQFVLKTPGGLRNTLDSFASGTLVLFLLFLPYLVVSGAHLARYFIANIFTAGQDIWSPPLSTFDNLKYYVIGGGGWATMRWWSVITVAVAMLAFLLVVRSRDVKALRIGGIYAAFAVVAWVGMTLLKNKSPWFGSVVSGHFIGIFLMASGYIIKALRMTPAARYLYAAVLVVLGVSLHTWPNSSGVLPGLNHDEISGYAREAKRVFAETCSAIQVYAGANRVSILVPAISLIVNPDLIDLCAVERDSVPMDVPRIYMQPYSQMLKTIQSSAESGELNMLALVLSADFPAIPGNLPTSKYLGSINYQFSSSRQFELVRVIRGPNGTGNIRVFRKIAAFSPIENESGMKDFEGPYPDKKLPIVRRALFPATEFDIQVSPGHRTRLTLAGRPAIPGIMANVRLNTGEENNCEFGEFSAGIFKECHLDFSAQTNLVHVKIEFRILNQTGSAPKAGEAILLSRLQAVNMENTVFKDPRLSESLFARIDFVDGFGDMEGPHTKLGLPVVIWGRGDSSRIGLAGVGNGLGVLVIEWRPGASVQSIDFLAKDNLVGRCMSGDIAGEPGNSFRHCEINLPPGAVSDDLTLRYVGDKQILSNKTNRSALFKRIQFIEKNG